MRLDDFKVWAKIDSEDDDIVELCLKQAALRIQEYTNIALLPCTISQTASRDIIRLMQPIEEVISVKDGRGNECAFTFSPEQFLTINTGVFSKGVIVEYSTEPSSSQVERMLIPVWELALAIYDGNIELQNRIILNLPLELC